MKELEIWFWLLEEYFVVFRAMKWDEVTHLVITNSKENRAKELTLGNLSS